MGVRLDENGYWMQDAGCWILDTGYRMLDAGCWIADWSPNK